MKKEKGKEILRNLKKSGYCSTKSSSKIYRQIEEELNGRVEELDNQNSKLISEVEDLVISLNFVLQ